ncbi:hypothetical protein BH23GEM6_BH23GEM6_02620 [soil metagenome]
MSEAIAEAEERCRRLQEVEETCEDLRRRVEESEALHSLGLAVNRTLNNDEVLNLVARFTRNLLGAHYVTVNTGADGRIYMVASVGLRNAKQGGEDYHLARIVVEAERPVIVGGADGALQVDSFPFHGAEGMKVGLGIPLTLFGDTFGSLIIGYRSDYSINPHDIRLALTLAGHAAVAISNARLHESVEQRSHDLEVAYAELNRATEAKERFFASISHELRNPLGAVIGYQTLLLDESVCEIPAAARKYLEKAHLAANTLRVLVDDLLDLSRIAAGKMELNLRDCALREIIDGALNTITPGAEAKGIPVVAADVDDAARVRTDPDRVQQILVNLLSNAVKFTSEGEVRLEISAAQPDDANPGQTADGEDENGGAAPSEDGAWIEIRARALYLEAICSWVRSACPSVAATIYNNLGMVCADLEEWMEAEMHFLRGIEIAERSGQPLQLAHLVTGGAEPLIRMGEFETARASLVRAEALATELQDSKILADVFRFKAMIARLEGEYDEAESHLTRALEITEAARTEQELGEALEEMARLRWATQRRGKARMVLREARRVYRSVGAEQDVARLDSTLTSWAALAPISPTG